MKRYNFILFLLSLILIFCEDVNSTSENTTSNKTFLFHHDSSFNVTINEMDTLMVCSIIVQHSLEKQKNEIYSVVKRMNLTKTDSVLEKVGTDIFEQCSKKIAISDVNIYMRNLTYYYNFKWNKKFDEFTKIDYSKYINPADLNLTEDQQILMYKYQKIDEIFRQKAEENREFIQNENKKIKIGKFDLENIPGYVKILVFFGIFSLFFGGLFYLLKTLEKKPIKKDKKKKKQQ